MRCSAGLPWYHLLVPLVASLAFGLCTATLLTLVMFPSLYNIFDYFGWMTKIDVTADLSPVRSESDPTPQPAAKNMRLSSQRWAFEADKDLVSTHISGHFEGCVDTSRRVLAYGKPLIALGPHNTNWR